MLKLRILLLRNILYYVILGIALLYFVFVNYFVQYESKYNNVSSLEVIITNIVKKNYGFKLDLKNDEKFIGYYYLEEKDMDIFYNEYSIGDKVYIEVEDKVINNNTLENTFNYKKYLYNKKIYKTFEIKTMEKVRDNKNIVYFIKDFLYRRSNKLEKSYPYINTLLFGNKNDLDSDVTSSYSENGISHLFAISGSHISVFVIILEGILKKFKIGENKRYIFLIVFLLLFMFLTNFSMSVVRASLFTILLFVNKIFYFYIKPENILLLTLSIIIFFNPLNLYDVGLLYSFFISLSLIIMSSYINKSSSYFMKLLKVSIISFVVSLPITIGNFYQINFLSIIYNLFFVPYVSFIVLPLVLISYIFPFFDGLLYVFVLIMENISLFLARIDISKIILCKPNVSINVLYIMSIILFLRGLYLNKRRYFTLLIIIFLINYIGIFNINDKLVFIDVGQGDLTFLTVNDTINLIDTGGVVMQSDSKDMSNIVKNKTIPYLKSLGIRKIDNLILTHGDYDHMGESIYLVNNFKVGKVIFNNGEYNKLELDLIKILEKKKIPYYKNMKVLDLNGDKLHFINNELYDNENDNSIVIYAKINNYKILLMGDAGVEVEEKILEKYSLKEIDILKVGHHGSNTSSSKVFIDSISPKYSIISAGRDNKFGHPTSEVLNTLSHSTIYRTDIDGSITFNIKSNKLKIETCSS